MDETETDVTKVDSFEDVSTGVDLADSVDDFEVSERGDHVVGVARGDDDGADLTELDCCVEVLKDEEEGGQGEGVEVGIPELAMLEDFWGELVLAVVIVSTEELALTEEVVSIEELVLTEDEGSVEELISTEELGLIEDEDSTEELALVEDERGIEELVTVVTAEELVKTEELVTAEELITAEDESDAEDSRIELDESPVDVKAVVDVCEVLEALGTLIVMLGLFPTHLLQVVSVRCRY